MKTDNATPAAEETNPNEGKPVQAPKLTKKPTKPAPAPAKEPELAGAEKPDIRAQLARLQQAELEEVSNHINNYLAEKGYELVPVIMLMGTQQNAQVQIRRKAQ